MERTARLSCISVIASALLSVPALADEKITLLTWNIPMYGDNIEGWIAEFNEIHPDIEVEWINKNGADWSTFYQTQIAAGTPPDVVDIQGALWAEYAANGHLLDLAPFLEDDPDFASRFVEESLDFWETADGELFMVPWYFNRTLIYLNKQMIEEAGIETPLESFDDIMTAANQLSGEGRTGFLTTNFDWLYWPLFRMNGVEILNEEMTEAAFNTPEALETLTALADGTKSGAINNISWTGRWVEPNTAFASGNVGIYMAPGAALFWAASQAEWINGDNIEVQDAPGNWWGTNHHGLGISATTEYPEAALDLVKIATSDRWQVELSNFFSILTLNQNIEQALIDRFKAEDPLKGRVLELTNTHLDKITGYIKSPLESRIKDAFWTSVQPALLGQTDPQAALDSAEAKVNRILARQ